MTAEEIKKFLFNPENIGNCEECPYNREITSAGRIAGGCGQQNCWVEIHCKDE